jgi:phage minor structural protein
VVDAVKPILYPSTETEFAANGIGALSSAKECIVTEERNGMFELSMVYPMDGIHYENIELRSIILAAPNPTAVPQPFRVYEISRPMNGLVTINAEHVAYDLNGIVVSPFTVSTCTAAFQSLKTSAATDCPFEFSTDKTTSANINITIPRTIWDILGGSAGGILDVYGTGEYEFDRWNVIFHKARGANNGVTIRYGKNLTDIQQEENCASVYTGIYPYWQGADGDVVTLGEKIINVDGTFDYTRIRTLDLSEYYEEAPTEDELRKTANSWLKNNDIGTPSVSLSISFVQLERTEEYKTLEMLEHVSLCDTVSVVFPKLGVTATAKCVKTVYNTLEERYESIELGDGRDSIESTIVAQQKKVEEQATDLSSKATYSYVDTTATEATTSANTYTDTTASSTLSSAKSYTNTTASNTLASAESYTDSAVKTGISNYDDYLTQLEIFNKLTNNGETQGIYMQDGKLYINMDYAKTGTLDANSINLSGAFTVYSGGAAGGSIGYMSGSAGAGIGVSAGNAYVIATGGGARMQAGSSSFYVVPGGATVDAATLVVNGNITCTGNITCSGTITSSSS